MSGARINRGRFPFEETPTGPDLRPKQEIRLRSTSTGNPPPPVEQSLIDYLMRTYPLTVSLSHTLRDYDRMAGIQEVIEHLQAVHDEQQQPPS